MPNNLINSIQKQLISLTNKKFSRSYITNYIVPIFDFIDNSKKTKFMISGSQGIGKSTILRLLEENFTHFYKKKLLSLSLDNYYLSKTKRMHMSTNIQPLLITRGVPGTHDIKKLSSDINKFENSYYPIKIPIFNKLKDERSKKYKIIDFKTDILILEGWCCGSPPLTAKYLKKNINLLERKFDKTNIWRNYYNHKLKTTYLKLFNRFDHLIYLKAPDFNSVLKWRLKQEKRMTKNKKNKIYAMNNKQIKNFIQYYEKITKWMIRELPFKSKVVIYVDKNQKIKKMRMN